jgi:predicted acylesterase/phospholipase RssA
MDPATIITSLVFSGGGPSGLITYGAAKYLAETAGFWRLADIKRMYGCSIGALLAVALALNYPWAWLDDYFIQRPWEKLLATSINLTALWGQKGVLDGDFITAIMEPLLTAKGLTAHVTLAELYAFTGVDIHMFTTNVNAILATTTTNSITGVSAGKCGFGKVDLSHTTHPDLPVCRALHMSMAFPLAFTPVYDPDTLALYIDGGLLNNYPVNDCLAKAAATAANAETVAETAANVLAFKNSWRSTAAVKKSPHLANESSLAEFLLTIIKQMARAFDTSTTQEPIANTVDCIIEDLEGFDNWIKAFSTVESRERLVALGSDQARAFLVERTAGGLTFKGAN